MASSYSSDLKLEIMVTGENSGTWGDITNTNLVLLQQSIAGYEAVSIAGGAQTTALAMTDGALSNARNAVIKLTGTITGNQVVTIPDGIEKTYTIENGTTGAFTVEFKTVSGTGPTWSTTDKGIKILYSDGTNIIDINVNLSTIVVPAGTVSLPSISTTGDTNTGIFFPAADTIGFTEGGAEAMRIASNGVVRIGNTTDVYSPTYTEFMVIGNYTAAQDNGITFLADATNSSTIGFTDDTHSTLRGSIQYNHSGDSMRFTTFTLERMRITSAGNVGINTTSPETKLHVKATSALLAPIIVEGTSTNGFNLISDRRSNGESTVNLGVQWSSIGMVLGSFVKPSTTSDSDATGFLSSFDGSSVKRSAIVVDGIAGNIKFLNTDTSATVAVDSPVAMSERMRIDSSGNVGIGTTAPESTLHVKGTDRLFSSIRLQSTDGNGVSLLSGRLNATEDNFTLGLAYSSASLVIGNRVKPSGSSESDATGFLSSSDNSTAKNAIKMNTNGDIQFYNAGSSSIAVDSVVAMTERMRITSLGNVGIGTTAPDAKLSVNGVASFGDGTALLPSIANFGDLNTGMWFPADDTIAFSTGGGERMRIKSDGNVGIGTSSPLYKLDVPSVSGARFSKSNVFLGKEVTIINSPGQTKTIEIATAGGGAYFKVIITGIYVPGSNLWSTYEYEKVYVNSLAVGGNSAIYTVLNQSVGSFQFQAGDFVISRPGSGVVRIVYTENASNNGNIYLNVNVIGLGGYGVPSAITIT